MEGRKKKIREVEVEVEVEVEGRRLGETNEEGKEENGPHVYLCAMDNYVFL